MYERILKRMREKVRARQYIMTLHAEEEMNDDALTIFDVERAILAGNIIERQHDHDMDEWKYVVLGRTINETRMTAVTKFGAMGKLVFITVYLE